MKRIFKAYKVLFEEPVTGKFHKRIHLTTLFVVVVSIVGNFIDININSNLSLPQLLIFIGLIYQMILFNQMNKAIEAREDFKKL